MEVKSANSSTFYVTGNVPNEMEEANLSTYSNTTQQQIPYGSSMTDMMVAGQVGVGGAMLVSSMPVAGSNEHQQPYLHGSQEHPPIQQQVQAQQLQGVYNNANQYYTSAATTGSHNNQNTQQPQLYLNQHDNSQQQQSHYSNMQAVNNQGSVQQQPTVQHYTNNSNQQATATNAQSGSAKQTPDPFKKWRHFYVNQRTQMQQYRFFQPGGDDAQSSSSQDNNQGIENNQKYVDRLQTQQQTPNSEQREQQVSQRYSGVSESRGTTGTGNETTPAIGGSMIARLRQEFCRNETQKNNHVHQTGTGGKEPLIAKKEAVSANAARSSVVSERMRSATPDFLSDRPLVAKQLPMRPNSANSKQRQQQDRPNQQPTFQQIRAQKLAKQKLESGSNPPVNDTSNVGGSPSKNHDVDNNANKIMSSMLKGSSTQARDSIHSGSQGVATTVGLVQAAREQLENQTSSKLSTSKSITASRGKVTDTALTSTPQNNTCRPPPSYPGNRVEMDASTSFTSARKSTELHRSCEMLDKVPGNGNQDQSPQGSGTASRPDLSSSQPDLSQLVGKLSISSGSGAVSGQRIQDSISSNSTVTGQKVHERSAFGGSSDSQDSNRWVGNVCYLFNFYSYIFLKNVIYIKNFQM